MPSAPRIPAVPTPDPDVPSHRARLRVAIGPAIALVLGIGLVMTMAGRAEGERMPLLLLYIGPDMLLPFTSALGAIAGVVLMFWQRLVALARRFWRFLRRRPA